LVGRAVHQPPGIAARGLIDWALDLWPYINGKALNSGVKLVDMDASDMVDVLHYYFESDMYMQSQTELDSKESTRKYLYRELYKVIYRERSETTEAPDFSFDDFEDESEEENGTPIKQFSPREKVKNYIPASLPDENSSLPFGMGLDAPLR
jgi:hypothetical protein